MQFNKLLSILLSILITKVIFIELIIFFIPYIGLSAQTKPIVYFMSITIIYFVLRFVFNFIQSNLEGELVNLIQDARKKFDGMIINAAAFTHTSVAIRDALDLFKKPIIELHLSNIYKREEFRHKSLISDVVTGGIFGLGAEGYILAIISLQKTLHNENR